MEETSSDNELSDWQRDDMDNVGRMTRSSDKVDKRLVEIYRIRKAQELGLHMGFKNPAGKKNYS